MRIFALLAVVLTGGAAQADTLGEQDKLVINRINATDFEVVETRTMAAADHWCGAASFVSRRNGLPESTPIYLKQARGPSVTVPGRKAVRFSTSNRGLPAPDAGRVTLTVEAPGEVMRSSTARRYCRDAFTRATK